MSPDLTSVAILSAREAIGSIAAHAKRTGATDAHCATACIASAMAMLAHVLTALGTEPDRAAEYVGGIAADLLPAAMRAVAIDLAAGRGN